MIRVIGGLLIKKSHKSRFAIMLTKILDNSVALSSFFYFDKKSLDCDSNSGLVGQCTSSHMTTMLLKYSFVNPGVTSDVLKYFQE